MILPAIRFLLTPNMLASSVALPLEMLNAAWSMAKVQNPAIGALDIGFWAEQPGNVMSHSGLPIKANALPKEVPCKAIVLIPALWRNPAKTLRQSPRCIEWLRRAAESNTLAAVGTGVCFLAEAGVLDGKNATTHWHYAKHFARRYPAVNLKQDVFITRSERIFCAASVNALSELIAFFIQEVFGSQIAQRIERHFFHEIRQPKTQATLASRTSTTDELVADAIALLEEWALNPSSERLSSQPVAELASVLKVSVRSLNRHFQQALGDTPLQYLQRQRLSIAEELLKTSNLAIADIAQHVGFAEPQQFTRQFKRHFGLVPSQYRKTVRGKLFTQPVTDSALQQTPPEIQ